MDGEVNPLRERPATMESLPPGIRSHGVLRRTADSPPIRDVLRGLPGRVSLHRAFRGFLASIETEFNSADELGGFQRIEVRDLLFPIHSISQFYLGFNFRGSYSC